jgi:DNA-binding HxlR family transcriptional regulator
LNLDGLRELAVIFRHRWDPIILGLLSDGPIRRRDLTQEVRDQDGEHISDGVLSETLTRLQDEGLITKDKTSANHAIYRATPAARRKIERLRQINEFAEAMRNEAPDA